MLIKNSLLKVSVWSVCSLALGMSAFAQGTPDEINYGPYYQTYLNYKSVSDDRRSQADSAKADVAGTQNQILMLNSRVNQNTTRMNDDAAMIDRRHHDLHDLENQNNANQAAVIRNQGAMAQDQNGIRDGQQKLSDLHVQSDQLNRDKAKADLDFNSANQANRDAETRLQTATHDRNDAKTKLDLAQKASTEQQVVVSSSGLQLTQQGAVSARLEQQAITLAQPVNALKTQVQDLQTELTVRTQAVKVATPEKLAAAKVAQQAALTRLNETKAHLVSAQSAVNQNRTQLDKAHADLTSTQKKLDQSKALLAQLQAAMPAQQELVRTKQAQLDAATSLTQTSRTTLATAQRRVEAAALGLQKLHDQQNALNTAVASLQNDNHALDSANHDLQKQTQNNLITLGAYRDEIVSRGQDIDQLNHENGGLAGQLDYAQGMLANQQGRFAQLNLVAMTAEAITQSHYQDYAVRKQRYDGMMADAVAVGSGYGTQSGQNDGSPKGQMDGQTIGTQDGLVRGQDQGLAAGLANGKQAGDDKGFSDGRAEGNNSTADHDRGNTDGLALGQQDAVSEAARMDYPKGLADQFAKLTASLPTNAVQLDQNNSRNSIVSNFARVAISVKSDKAGADYQTNLMTSTAVANDGSDVCTQSFPDFKNGCLASYKSSYDSSYQASYQAAYDSNYKTYAEQARAAAFEQNKTVRYQEGYDLTYKPGFQRGLSAGALEAYQRGVTEGRASGYQANRASAGTDAYAKGIDDQTQHFLNASVTLMKSVRVTRVGLDGTLGGSVGASDLLKLEMTVANYGSQASGQTPVKVELMAMTSGLSVSQSVTQLISVPGNSVAVVSNVLTAKVLETSTTASVEKLSVKFTDEQGHEMTKTISVTISPELQVTFTDLKFDSSPRAEKTKDMKVTLSNTGSTDPTAKVTLGLATSAPGSVLRLDQSSVEVYELPAGSTFVIEGLSYTALDKDALSNGIPMSVYVKHGGRIVARQNVMLQR
jgi:hypothetical protein